MIFYTTRENLIGRYFVEVKMNWVNCASWSYRLEGQSHDESMVAGIQFLQSSSR